MKLHEIRGSSKRKDSSNNTKNVTIDSYNMGEMKLKVTFDYEAGFSDRHGDNSSFDENHPEQFMITKIELAAPLTIEDFEGEEKTYPKGTNVDDLPDWNDRKDTDLVLDELYGKK